MGLNPQQVKGGYVAIWEEEEKQQMEYCGGAFSIPEATKEELEDARKGEITIFNR